MAVYRLEAKIVKRSAGHTSTAAAAYRAAAELHDERTGQLFDYSRKRGVLHTEILAPDDAPDWMRDRGQLWNAVERVERRKDAQLARDVLVSLPHEMTDDERRDLVRDFAREAFVARGMIADVAIHAPDRRGDQRNHHAHILLTMRELTGDGFGPKARAWNETSELEGWRSTFADVVNRHLEKNGYDVQVDHRSLAARGLDREPEPKQGPVATKMEREGRASHAGDDRRAARERNQERAELESAKAQIEAEIIDLDKERRRRAEEMTERDAAARPPTPEGLPTVEELAEEQLRIQRRQLDELKAEDLRIRAFLDSARRQAEARQGRQRDEGRVDDAQPCDAAQRYAKALKGHYSARSPYASLAEAAVAEHRAFMQDRKALTEALEQAATPEARRRLELRRDIEAADYMAITSERIAGQSVVISGRADSPEAIRQRERAATFRSEAKVLREELGVPDRESRATRQRGGDASTPRSAAPDAKESGREARRAARRESLGLAPRPPQPPGRDREEENER
jgi:hypothetical protein